MELLSPLRLPCGVTAPSRLVFGPHETNLGRGRAFSERHVAYYERRAAGGAGVIVTETASVHDRDWPYERAPLAEECAPGWAAVAESCRRWGAVALASLGHTGQQGSSAYSQSAMWAPSRVPDVVSREVPMEMDSDEIAEVVEGFAAAARLAVGSGLHGVEVNAGQSSLVRQFMSGLTNQRQDEYGAPDRARFAREVVAAVRGAIGPDSVLGLRVSCDEMAPWAGITPEDAVPLAAELAVCGALDYVAVVRGSIYSREATRPDGHIPPGFNTDLARAVRGGLGSAAAVCAQGSIVDSDMAERLLQEGTAQLVEMTRAQIADGELGAKLAAGSPERVRPCILCNQMCQVLDARNPLVSCVGDPLSGHESDDAAAGSAPAAALVEMLVIGGGPAGLAAARTAAAAGHGVHVMEAADEAGGMLRTAAAGSGRERLSLLVDWLAAECGRLGVVLETGRRATAADIDARLATGGRVLLCTGGTAGEVAYPADGSVRVLDAAALLSMADERQGSAPTAGPVAVFEPAVLDPGGGPVAVFDPVGGPVAVSVCESLAACGYGVTLITPDHVAGSQLARTGDLAPASTRLAQAGVEVLKRSRVRAADQGGVLVEHVFTGEQSRVAASVLVDCGFRVPEDGLWRGPRVGVARAGDAVAPRSVHEAVLEGRRVVREVEEVPLESGAAAVRRVPR